MSSAEKDAVQLPAASTVATRVTPSTTTVTVAPGSVVPLSVTPALCSASFTMLSAVTGFALTAKLRTNVSTITVSLRVRALPAASTV